MNVYKVGRTVDEQRGPVATLLVLDSEERAGLADGTEVGHVDLLAAAGPLLLPAGAGRGARELRHALAEDAAEGLELVLVEALHGRQHLPRRRRAARRRATQRRASPYPNGVYDADTAAEYFSSRPFRVASRALELLSNGLGFGVKLLIDRQTGNQEAAADERADELTRILTDLGPTFIKIGQALSIRADLLPPAYLRSLTELQDRVPPFPTKEADAIIENELGLPVGELFEDISAEPIASASLGQVYRARLRDGPEVAVKVQRPAMEEVVALDLYLLKTGAGPLQRLLSALGTGLNTDLVGLIDAWGVGFVGELDYREEARNAEGFQEAIQRTPLGGAVFSPPVVAACSSRKVLTSEWIDGERLERSTAEDVTKLCSVAMNTYLTMLLETGVLHADPHPGNLLRTPDGRLCILDWGLVTSLNEDFRVSYIEHVAHLVSGDYAPVPSDLVKLGFVPDGKEAEIEQSEVVTLLADVYGQWTGGGGAARIDANRVFAEIQGLSNRYGNLFRVPPYFFYIARAFAVLEGIGLSNDKEYSVVSECLPYVSQRLLTDQDPRIAGALASFIYGEQKDRPDRQVDVVRIDYLADGFSSYTAATGALTAQRPPAEEVGRLVEQLGELLLGEGGGSDVRPSALQQLVVEELAKVVGAGARQAVASTGFFSDEEGSGRRPTSLVPDEADRRALEIARRLADVAEPRVRELLEAFRALPFEEQRDVAREVLGKLWDYRGGALAAGGRLAAKLFSQGLLRVRRDLASPASASGA
mmetsp:Transcript_63702/g.197693  ORF Transcript_63702/g.197693 Transcript_63702/m.197693 type:complete len:762 (+) Transcript_63702:678-2963(+)